MQRERSGDDIQRRRRTELVEEPQPLLGKRKWRRLLQPLCGSGLQVAYAVRVQTGLTCLARLNEPGHLRDGGRLEHGGERDFNPKSIEYAGDELNRRQRMAPEFEKGVVHADTIKF